ncbi:MAG TPA: hypothetical protein DIT28_06715 [Oxalobacteraceae bacterium]|nr:hypothetical protein [Oxalobacteraceae bacterium]
MMMMRGGNVTAAASKNASPGKARGKVRLEFLVFVVTAGILAGILLDRMLDYQEYAEKTAMDLTVLNMRSGLRLRLAELMMQDRMGEAGKLLDENPIKWLETPPPNYRGSLRDVNPGDISPGNWYFDAGRKDLVYVPYRNTIFGRVADAKKFMVLHVAAKTSSEAAGRSRKVENVTLTMIPR